MAKERLKIIPAVYIIFLKGNQILLMRRSHTGFCDGEYGLPSGHLEKDETLIQSALREAKEETGIKLTPTNLELVHVLSRKKPNKEVYVDLFFVAKKWRGEPKICELQRCDHQDWFPLNNLPINMIDYVRQTLDFIDKKKFYSEFGWLG